jgi:hypothetical protein
MLGVKGLRFALRMVPTPEQRLELIKATEKMFADSELPPNPWVLHGIEDEQIFTIDQAIAALQIYKARETLVAVSVYETQPSCPAIDQAIAALIQSSNPKQSE